MATFSIHSNSAASVALTTLSAVNNNLAATQKQISTGKKVADATDNASVFAVAQGVRANLQSFDSINQSLVNAQTLVNVALNGATTVSTIIADITKTLGSLANGALTTDQRSDYTTDLKAEIDEVQTVITSSSYNDGSLIAAGSFTPADLAAHVAVPVPNLAALTGTAGQTILLQASDLLGSAQFFFTTGVLGLLRLSYCVGTIANDTSNDTFANARLYQDTNNALVSRTAVFQNEAIAALAALSASSVAFVPAGQTAGHPSVFGASLAYFTNQVNGALATLGADYTNIDAQITFNQSYANTATAALGQLVDANLAQVSAKLTALTTQQKLATESLGIVNAQPENLLQLFRNAA